MNKIISKLSNKQYLSLVFKLILGLVLVIGLGQSKTLTNAETTKTLKVSSAGSVFKQLSKSSYAQKLQALQTTESTTQIVESTEVAVSDENLTTEASTVVDNQVYTEVQATNTQVVYSGNTSGTTSYTLTNGNTAGEVGSAAAAQMAAATGVSKETWEYIIARESNGDYTAANSSGASGLFQTMPGWGSTATVDDQVQAAINAYNAQGLSAWGLQ
ncbi:transglycosylase SLT domain-containing protein [Streptococcus caprae]|uniref:Lytic transglycosylase domain-containing protein n=1 Tax=Streptococcus caprae TaxID=1640501 RepID=A0ABV8CVF4_9STRE